MKPLISIIVPIYNVEEFLPKCIDSILKQTYENFELILVNDGSPDNCKEICMEYSQKDNRIIVINKENGGLSSARNAGIDYASGEYIGFVDSDDYIASDMYEVLLSNMLKEKVEISICGRYYVYGVKNVVKHRQNIYLKMSSEEAIKKMNTFGYYDVASWDKLYKKELFNGIRFPLNKLSEDWYTTYKLFDKAKSVIYDSTPKYYYRQRNQSITHSKKVNYEPIYASKEVLNLVREKYPNSIDSAISAYVYANIGVYDNLILYDKTNKKDILNILKVVKMNYKIVIKNNELGLSRKVQLRLLRFSPVIYNMLFELFNYLRSFKL